MVSPDLYRLALQGASMRLSLIAPFTHVRHVDLADTHGLPLGRLCHGQADAITACQVNDAFIDAWQDYVPQASDHITWYTTPGVDPVTLGVTATTALILNTLIATAISTAISIGLSYLIRALSPTPANTAGKPEQVFGIAGLTNTTAQGTPKWLVYGRRRIFGHIIDTRVQISQDGKFSIFGILYFMGEGPIAGITDIQINDTAVSQFSGVGFEVRLGDGNTTPIPFFDTVSAVWSDGRSLPEDTSIVYTTHGEDVERVTLIFVTPFLFHQRGDGSRARAEHTLTIEYKTVASGSYLTADFSPFVWADRAEAQRFQSFMIQFDHADQWNVRVTLTDTTNESSTVPSLYNVQEEQTSTSLYPTSALLAITGIPSTQITSFEGMRASAMVQGLIVQVWDGATLTDAWSDNRAWVLRHLLTNERIGLGHRIAASMFDDDAALVAANVWDTDVGGVKVNECHVIINDRRQAWDWVKMLLSEGRAILIPSGGLLSLRVDQAGTPGLLYAAPGNIVEGSVRTTAGDGQGALQNTIRSQFPNRDNDDIVEVMEYTTPDIGDEPVRESLVTISSLTHRNQVYWFMRYQLLRSRLIRRHYQWQSPLTALVSEPLDIIALSHDTATYTRGISGFCPFGSTISRLLLDRPVELASSTTYTVLLRHQADNTVEQRTVSNAAGTWGALTMTLAFDTAPAENDLWAIGEHSSAMVTLTLESVDMDDDGVYALSASDYQASLYDTPAPPDPTTRPPTNTFHTKALPLWHAAVAEVPRIDEAGGTRSSLVFTVTPSLQVHSGVAQGGTTTTIQLQADEPFQGTDAYSLSELDDFYVGATLAIVEGTGVGGSAVVTIYDQATQTCTVSPAWTAPDATSVYQLTWPAAQDTTGFLVEEAEAFGVGVGLTRISEYVELGRFVGTIGEWSPEVGPYLSLYRFTPLSVSGVQQFQGRWVQALTVAGDQTAPGAPSDGMES